VLSDLFWITMGSALLVFIAVEFLIIYTALRFRKRPGTPETEPYQLHGNTRLEVMWTILPALLLVSLFIISVRGMSQVSSFPANALTIQVVGRQFSWEFAYPQGNVRSINDLRIPVGQPIVLEVTAQDVIHSFWVPDLAGKIDANPGLTNRTTFTAERPGVYRGVCAELCGIGHAAMLFQVTAMEPGEFQAWLAEGGQVAAAQAAAGPNVDAGRRLVVEKGCGACHAIGGLAGMAGNIGPPLNNIGATAATRKPGTSAEAYLRESMEEPNAFTVSGFPPGLMPRLELTEQERDSIVAYLLTLR
jgi:cytochrome c oxidase subunit 2